MISSVFAEPLQQEDRVYVRWRGQKLLYFAGCDYFRLSSDPRVLRAVSQSIKAHGLNVAASRKTTGNHHLFEQLEEETARFFNAPAAVLLSNGYLTNLAVAQALKSKTVFMDEFAHGSLRDAAALGNYRVVQFRHRNPANLRAKMKKTCGLVMTDGLFSHDGSIAPLQEYNGASLIWVDDSHAAGVLGQHGRGTPEGTGLKWEQTIQTVTFSKAFGVYGGAILCSRKFAREIAESSQIVAGNTPLPLPLVSGVLTALKIVQTERPYEKLARNIDRVNDGIGRTWRTPIVGIVPQGAQAGKIKKALLKRGIFPPLIRYGCSQTAYFRLAISSEHTPEQLDLLVEALLEGGLKRP